MMFLTPEHTEHAGDAAETQVLIEEARARARHRRRRNALVVALAAVLAAGAFAAVRARSGGRPTVRANTSRPPAAAPAAGGFPRFFADFETSGGSTTGGMALEIRDSATGKLVTTPSMRNPYSVVATGPRSFVVAVPVGSTCSTRLYRFNLNQQGRTSALRRVGPTLPGVLWALTASTDGKVVGYAISGCSKGDSGYLGVLDVASGRTRRWTDVSLGGVSFGNLGVGGLSMSANGRLLAFAAAFTAHPPFGRTTAQEVRVLPTNASAGTLAARSHVVFRDAGTTPQLAAAVLSPSGKLFYLCSETGTRTKATARIVAYHTASGKPAGVIATFTKKGHYPTVGCASMTLGPSGRFLLVPYALSHSRPHDPYAGRDLFRLARVGIATKATSKVTVSIAANGGMDQPTGMKVAW